MAAAATPKGRAEKQVLAWRLHGRTTVTRRWIAEKLVVGYAMADPSCLAWRTTGTVYTQSNSVQLCVQCVRRSSQPSCLR
jgi:hypothetical protein